MHEAKWSSLLPISQHLYGCVQGMCLNSKLISLCQYVPGFSLIIYSSCILTKQPCRHLHFWSHKMSDFCTSLQLSSLMCSELLCLLQWRGQINRNKKKVLAGRNRKPLHRVASEGNTSKASGNVGVHVGVHCVSEENGREQPVMPHPSPGLSLLGLLLLSGEPTVGVSRCLECPKQPGGSGGASLILDYCTLARLGAGQQSTPLPSLLIGHLLSLFEELFTCAAAEKQL